MWEFCIDVGGTFTDCLARTPDGQRLSCKVLSSGITKGQVRSIVGKHQFTDSSRSNTIDDFWIGYNVRLLDATGAPRFRSHISAFDSATGALTTADPLPAELERGSVYELFSDEDAPIIAVRTLLNLRRDQPIPPIIMHLGTTRGTNALLTRSGARTAFVTTRGFGDILRIANQDRPRLFDLEIKKPIPLFETVLEVNERIDARGTVLYSPDRALVRQQFAELKQSGTESLAICLMHAFVNPHHERILAEEARAVGFHEISLSSNVSPTIKIVPRGDTTVVDAYLNPVLRCYLESIESKLHLAIKRTESDTIGTASNSARPGQLRLMTSAGGLVTTELFTGKDSILSGPAGGVIGFSKLAQSAGFDKAIGFDMGGTSTDVSRFDGQYEMQYETQKAGVRIATPMLSIETVAAGGGSVCRFDGVKLTVGPASAGSDPGPACYGRGGPLTVTDVNLFLGKLLPSRFPFPLDLEVVERHLEKLCREIAAVAGGVQYTPHQLAQGFVNVANANMVRPIRSISVAKGYDPRDYVLINFGSAAGQHACAVARELGIQQILSHPLAGLLSAYGIGLADVRRHAEQSVLKPYSAETVSQLPALFEQLEQRCQAGTDNAETAQLDQVSVIRSLDLRYRGVEATINVPQPDDHDYERRYIELHRQRFGYVHTAREIQIAVARVEVVIRSQSVPTSSAIKARRQPVPSEMTQAWFDGRPHPTAVFTRDQLQAGDELIGPAIVCEPTSTLVIEPGFLGQILSQGEVLITSHQPAVKSSPANLTIADNADPTLLEIFNNQFTSIAERMGLTLQRTAISTNVKERLDFSCALFSAEGDLVVNAPHIPVHLGAMSETVQRLLQDHPDMQVGDVYVTNDPYRGGSHLPDVTVVTPVHDVKSKRLLFFTASRAHHAEIGGITPGSMPPFSRRLSEEGVLIRQFKLIEQGQSHEAELRSLLLNATYPTRAIEDNLADLAAQVAANQTGARGLRELIEHHSLPIVTAYMQHIQMAAEQKTRRALLRIPSGTYHWSDHLDDGATLEVTITIEHDSAIVDFQGTSSVLAGNLNANRAIVTACVLYVFRCLIDEDIPLNGGVLKPIEIRLPPCFLNPPEHDDPSQCAAIVGGNVETSQRIVDALLGALGVAAASQGTMNNLTFGDDTFGYYETICGGSGATHRADGADAVHTHMTNTRLTDPEVLEWRYPVRVREFSIRRGSGGAGEHHGGDGVTRRIEFLKPLRLSILSERRGPYAPFELEGGHSGQCGKNTIRRANTGLDEDVGAKVQTTVEPGDLLTIQTPGGGGFGEVAHPQ